MSDRFTTPKGIAAGILLVGLLVAVSIGLGAYALVKQGRTDRQVEKIAQRVFLIEQPTEAQKQKGLKNAVKELKGPAGAAILGALLKSATPKQRRELREILKGGDTANNPGSGPTGPGTTPGPSPKPNVPPVTVPPVTTPELPGVPPVTTPPVTVPPVTVPPVPCLPIPVQHC